MSKGMNKSFSLNGTEICKTVIRCLIMLLFSALIGFVLLVFVYMLPTAPMKANLNQDIDEISKEGVYPAIHWKFSNTLDNFTDSLMMGAAVYDNEETVVNKAINAYHPSGFEDPVQDLTNYVRNGDNGEHGSYTRYWHGYLVFLKPILSMTDYLMWRSINRVFQIIVMVTLTLILIKRFSWKCAVPMVAAFMFLRPNIIYYSLQYSTMFYVSMFSVMALALIYQKNGDNKRLVYFYFAVGIVTNYFDYLTYPALSLGLCLILCAMLSQSQTGLKNIVNTIIYSISWAFGYAGMWISKWTIATILTGENKFSDAIISIVGRSSTEAYGGSISRTAAIVSNMQMASEVITPLIVMVMIISLVIIAILQWRRQLKLFLPYVANILIIAAIPFVWYLVLSNHSYIHLYFTFRTLAITVAALFAVAFNIEKKKI